MAGRHAQGALGGAGAFHRPVPAARRAHAGRGRPTGQWFTFEYGATKAGSGNGWADIWRRARFGWEYKGKGKDLQAAFKQLQLYAPALEYPPLLIVCDIDSIVIHTAFTGTVPTVRVITLDDLRDPKARQVLKWAFTDPERLRPGQTTAALTESAAGRWPLRRPGPDPARARPRRLECRPFLHPTAVLPVRRGHRPAAAAAVHPAARRRPG